LQKKKVRPKLPVSPLPENADTHWSPRLVWTRGNELPEMGGVCAVGDQVLSQLPIQCTGLQYKRPNKTTALNQIRCVAAACFPNLFLIGASKSGTTTLFEALVSHPRIVEMLALPNTAGETHVFTEPPPSKDNSYYTLRALRRAAPIWRPRSLHNVNFLNSSNLYILEYTPHYLVIPEARERLCSSSSALFKAPYCNYAKYIIMLRDPTLRAFSQWIMKTHMRVARYNEQRDFETAVLQGQNRTTRYAYCWDQQLGLSFDLSRDSLRIHRLAAGRCHPRRFEPNLFQAYVLKSAYYYQLLPWLAGLAQPLSEHAVILCLEHLTPLTLSRLVTTFLHLPLVHATQGYTDIEQVHDLVQSKRNVARDLSAKIPTGIQHSLNEFFRPFNKKLDKLVAPILYCSSSSSSSSRSSNDAERRATTGYPT